MSFDSVRFGELFAEPQKNGLTRPKKVRGSGFPMVNMGELFAYPRIQNILMDLVPVEEKESHYFLESGDLLFARQSLVLSGAGQCSIFLGNAVPTVFESHLIRCRLNKQYCNPLFYFYFFRSPVGRTVIEAIVEQGAGASWIRGSDLINIQVPKPPKNFQDSAALILSTLDDRIALLHETNATLEAIAQALFKSWFVDFDPVHANAAFLENGEAPSLPAEIQALFPSRLVESPQGLIPEGWEVCTIADVTETLGGATPNTKNEEFWNPPEVSWTSPKDLSGLNSPVFLETERKISKLGLSKISSGLLPIGTLLMSSRAPIGYLAMAQVPLAINQGYIAMPPGGKLPPLFMLYWCRQNMEVIENRANGSTFMEISKKAFRPIEIILPPRTVVDAFMATGETLFDRLVENEKQIRSLSDLRDTLLPRLISGQLRLPEVEAALAEVY